MEVNMKRFLEQVLKNLEDHKENYEDEEKSRL